MGDVLAEKWPAGCHGRERRRFIRLISAIAQTTRTTESKQQLLLGAERGEIRKEAPVHPRADRRIRRAFYARPGETLEMVHIQF